MADAVLPEYLWLVVVGTIVAFSFGYATGSNDVANAFATSVGSKTLTLLQAVIIAAIFEFLGAILLGQVSTEVIAGSIAKPEVFARDPEFYAYGMVVALFVGTVWQLGASYLGLNVSATHSIIGAIMGFALVYGGLDAVNWAKESKGNIPPVTGVVPIIAAWFVSPILTGTVAAVIYLICRTFILRRRNSWQLSLWVLPISVFVTGFINVFFVLARGARKQLDPKNTSWRTVDSVWVAAVCAAGLALLSGVLAFTLLRWRLIKVFNDREAAANDPEAAAKAAALAAAPVVEKHGAAKFAEMAKKQALKGINYDIHQVAIEDPVVKAIHENAEKFDPRAEYVFSYLQVFSAICVIFAHGAGEVGYMSGPLATIYSVYRNGSIYKCNSKGKCETKVSPTIWITLVGAFGLVFGLATYGYKVTQAMGTMLAKITPTRGFAAELATATVILIASQLKLPTSSSQCITGAIVGVGLVDGAKGVNWKLFAKQFVSWMLTLFAVAGFTAAFYAQAVYAPSVPMVKDIDRYEDLAINQTQTIIKTFDDGLKSYKSAACAGAIPSLSCDQLNSLNHTIQVLKNDTKRFQDYKKSPSLSPEKVFNQTYTALNLTQKYSIFTLGQVNTVPGAQICNNNVTADISAGVTVPCPTIGLLPKGVKAPIMK